MLGHRHNHDKTPARDGPRAHRCMATQPQQLLWAEEPDDGHPATADASPSLPPPPATPLSSTSPTPPVFDPIPTFPPLPAAIEAGVFGVGAKGQWALDEEEVRTLTEEHARELTGILADLQVTEDGLRTGEDPRTGKQPQSPESQTRLREYLETELPRLQAAYADSLAAFAGGFGDEAAGRLDLWVRKAVADCIHAPGCRYDPGHPWHYYHEGDNAPPIAVEDIPPDLGAGAYIERDLPKNHVKRARRICELLQSERERLEEDRRRYQDIVERGAEALSRYDREIAHTSDAMARATALALKFNHIRWGAGRVAWLQRHQSPTLPLDGDI